MKLARRKRERFGIRTPERVRSEGHLKWIRGFPCLVADPGYIDGPCEHRIQAAHVRTGTDGGTSLKPGDNWTVPLCDKHHAEQHRIGENAFELKYSVTLRDCAWELWERSPHRIKWERAQERTG